MIRKMLTGWLVAGAVWCLVLRGEPAQAQTMYALLTNGAPEKRVNILIMAEGYTSSQMGQFLVDATNLMNQFLAAQPYASYRACFNVYALTVASSESGSDHPSQGVYRNTYFNSTYDSYGSPEYLTIPPNDYITNSAYGWGKVSSLLQKWLPQCDVPLLLVNDLAYGGSGGSVLICSRYPGVEDIVLHEAGHTLAGLGDEYSEAMPGYPATEEPNTTCETRRDFIKWKAWIQADTPIPTPETEDYADRVGLFEGAHYQQTGWYRPRLNCKMRDINYDYCEVCREALIRSFYKKVRPIQGISPTQTNLGSVIAETLVFSVTPLAPPAGQMSIQWSLDGTAVTGAISNTYRLNSGSLTNGTHSVAVQVRDATPMVRTDADQRLRQTTNWLVTVSIPYMRLAAGRKTNGVVPFVVTGWASKGIVVESSTNLTTWVPVMTNGFSSGQFSFSVGASNSPSRRFYRSRAVQQ